MDGYVSPLEKARKLLRQIELQDEVLQTLPGNDGTSASPEADSSVENVNPSEKTGQNQTDAYQIKTSASDNPLGRIFPVKSEDLIRGVIYSEILSRPKAFRRGRW